ncbi:MAG: hypothetical protein H8D45_12290 [Bacteroidetes bacterium]|nr:hypothetical protein [Bacteroidota bacterium]MBL7104704.1 hypothetical protein [Bacteroidales bacterium]
MKKLSYLLGLIIVAGIIFNACKKDEDETQPPSISFKTGTHEQTGMKYLTSDTTLYVNEYFLVGISASTNISKDLNRFQILRKYETEDVVIYKDTSFSSSTFNIDAFIKANKQDDIEDFTFKIYDKADNYNSLHLTITTIPLPSTLNEYTNVELFYDTISPNSAFASTTGEVINIANAAANANKVDWIYFKDLIYGHTIIAPTETSILLDLFDTAYITGWSQYNATTFARTQWAASEFDGIDNKTSLIAATWNQDYSTFISQLKPEPGEGFDVNDVYAFYTGQYKYGLIKITEVNKGAKNGESSIKCDVKVVK